MSNYRELLPEERKALELFAKHHGRAWRRELNEVYWYNARLWSHPDMPNVGSTLHGIRNTFGPTWLYDVYKPTKKND